MTEFREGLESPDRMQKAGAASRTLLARLSKSRANYWASYMVDFSCPVIFAWLGVHFQHGLISRLGTAVFGLALFTLVEYAIHRWLLHDPRSILYQSHEAHHHNPEHLAAFLFPTSFLVLMPIWLLFNNVFQMHGTSFFLCGFSAGYCYFGALHHFEHTTRINQIPFRWLQGRWAAHSVHHHLDDSNFGVMTSFWDHIFRTHQKDRKRRSMAA